MIYAIVILIIWNLVLTKYVSDLEEEGKADKSDVRNTDYRARQTEDNHFMLCERFNRLMSYLRLEEVDQSPRIIRKKK